MTDNSIGEPIFEPPRARIAIAGAVICAAWILAVLVVWLWRGWQVVPEGPLIVGRIGTEIAPQARALATFVFQVLIICGLGRMVSKGASLDIHTNHPALRITVHLLLGQIAASLVVFVLGVLHLYPWGLLLLLGGLGGWWPVFSTKAPSRPGCQHGTLMWILRGSAAMLCFVPFVASFAPVVESDGLRYHLFGPQEYLKAGGIVYLPYHAFTNLPFQTNMLFTWSMAWGGTRAAQSMHWIHLPELIVIGTALADRLIRSMNAARTSRIDGSSSNPWSLLAGLAAASCPVVLVIAAWPFVDVSTTVYSLAAMWALCPGSMKQLNKRGLLSGIFAGAAVGTKLTAVAVGGLLGVVVLAMVVVRRKPLLLAAFCLPAALVPSPWFIKNVIYTGNPVYPAAHGLFGGGEWNEAVDVRYKSKTREKGIGRDAQDLFLSPADVTLRWKTNFTDQREDDLALRFRRVFGTMSPGFEDHNPGPAMLALLPIALFGVGRVLARLRASVVVWIVVLQGAGGWLFWFYTYQSVRFLLVPMAVIIIAGVCTLSTLSRSMIVKSFLQCLVGLLILCGAAWNVTYTVAVSAWRPVVMALGCMPEEEYLSRALNFYNGVALLNEIVEPGEKVLYLGEHRGLYAKYPVMLSDWYDVPRILAEFRATPNNTAMIQGWRQNGVRYILCNFEELDQYRERYFFPLMSPQEISRFQQLRTTISRAHDAPYVSRGLIVSDINLFLQ